MELSSNLMKKAKSLGSILSWGKVAAAASSSANNNHDLNISGSSYNSDTNSRNDIALQFNQDAEITIRDINPALLTTSIPTVVQTNKLQIDNVKGSTFVNQYVIIKDVGQGSHGKVKLCLDLEKECLVAVKIVDKASVKAQKLNTLRRRNRPAFDPLQDLMREIAIMKKLRHANVVRLFEVIDDPAHGTNKIFMIMDYIEGGPVVRSNNSNYTRIPETLALRYFRDILKGLEYLHYNNVVHGDLKPENLLLSSEGRVKISDFGSARVVEDNSLIQIQAGTPAFNAPEMCDASQPHYDGFKADIWALGVCLYVFVFGKVPFAGSWIELYETIRKQAVTFPKDIRISADLKNLLNLLLEKDPSKRIMCDRILEHPWITMRGKLPKLFSSSTTHRRIRVTEADQVGALTASDSNWLGSLSQLVSFELVTFKKGDYLIRCNEQVEGVYFIEQGECEVYNRESQQADEDFGVEYDDEEEEDELDELDAAMQDDFDAVLEAECSENMVTASSGGSDLLQSEKGLLKQGLNRTQSQHIKMRNMVAKAYESVSSLPNLGIEECSYKIGPGSTIGNLNLWGDQIRNEDVIAKTDVVARVARKERIEALLKKNPEQEHAIRTIITRHQSLSTKVKALQDVASYHQHFMEIDEVRQRSMSWCPEYSTGTDSKDGLVSKHVSFRQEMEKQLDGNHPFGHELDLDRAHSALPQNSLEHPRHVHFSQELVL